MKINHRIALRSDVPLWNRIERAGVVIDRDSCGIWVVNVTEDDPAWPVVHEVLRDRPDCVEIVSNIYTKRELDNAEWLKMSARGHHGYPQPEDGFGYIEQTYDVADYCPICGIGGTQKAPFRLRSEPKASRSQFLQLNWAFDEFFVRCEARHGLESAGISGIEFVSPVLHRKDQPSVQVSQMKISTVLPDALDNHELTHVTCKPENEEWSPGSRLTDAERKGTPYCGRNKYHLQHRGSLKFDRSAFKDAPDVVKSREWFGSGARAFRLIIVSQAFRQVVVRSKWCGVTFEPIELVKTAK